MVTKINFIAEDVNVEEFPYVFFALISIEALLSGEPLSDFGEFFRDSFGLGLFIFAASNVRDELVESSHVCTSCDSEHLKTNLLIISNFKIFPFYVLI